MHEITDLEVNVLQELKKKQKMRIIGRTLTLQHPLAEEV